MEKNGGISLSERTNLTSEILKKSHSLHEGRPQDLSYRKLDEYQILKSEINH